MGEIDYNKLKVKAGLEIHQQLDTGKLFCRCPGHLRKDASEFEVRRRLHAVPGEEGEVDSAVKHEASLGKEFVYEGYKENVCLVDLDEEPPKLVNQNALEEVLKICLLLNCELYLDSQVMRKTVIDGSNTSGFQRTVLIGHNGYVETSFGKVGIESIALEEDSARLIKRGKDKVTFRLDRLGIPLVEITTKPDMDTPEKIKETALKIGEILRACKVRRGLGTIRQDVNVSSKGHDRVEIKGFQDAKMMIDTVNKEIERQQSDVKKGKSEGHVRNALPTGKSEFLRPMPGRARMYPETDLPLLHLGRELVNKIRKNLPKLREEIRKELKKKGLAEELIKLVLEDRAYDELKTLCKVCDDINLVAKMTTLWRSEIAGREKKDFEEIREKLSERVLEQILEAVSKKKLEKGHVKEVMLAVFEGKSVEKALKVEKVCDDEVEEAVRKLVKDKPGLGKNAYMGLVMKEFKGKVDARKAMEIVKKVIEG